MADLKQEEIADYLSAIIKRLEENRARISNLEEQQATNRIPDVPYAGPVNMLSPQIPAVVQVTSIATTHFYALRCRPDANREDGDPWTIDQQLKTIQVFQPPNQIEEELPKVGDQVIAHFTGREYSSSNRAVYGYFDNIGLAVCNNAECDPSTLACQFTYEKVKRAVFGRGIRAVLVDSYTVGLATLHRITGKGICTAPTSRSSFSVYNTRLHFDDSFFLSVIGSCAVHVQGGLRVCYNGNTTCPTITDCEPGSSFGIVSQLVINKGLKMEAIQAAGICNGAVLQTDIKACGYSEDPCSTSTPTTACYEFDELEFGGGFYLEQDAQNNCKVVVQGSGQISICKIPNQCEVNSGEIVPSTNCDSGESESFSLLRLGEGLSFTPDSEGCGAAVVWADIQVCDTGRKDDGGPCEFDGAGTIYNAVKWIIGNGLSITDITSCMVKLDVDIFWDDEQFTDLRPGDCIVHTIVDKEVTFGFDTEVQSLVVVGDFVTDANLVVADNVLELWLTTSEYSQKVNACGVPIDIMEVTDTSSTLVVSIPVTDLESI